MPENASKNVGFDKTKPYAGAVKSSTANPKAKNPTTSATSVKHASSRGVEHPIPEDFALMGDTRHALHYKTLPRNEHPYKRDMNPHSAGSGNNPEEFRVESGSGVDGEL